MKVAVTGGSGRTGPAILKEMMDHGCEVVNLDRVAPETPTCPFRKIDLTDAGNVLEALRGHDAVVHLAAIPGPHNHPGHVVYTNNTVSTWNILDACAQLGIRKLCIASSINALGMVFSENPTFDYFPVDEAHRTRAEDAYSLSKWVNEQAADAFARLHEDMAIATMRFHMLVAPQVYRRFPIRNPEGMRKDLWGYSDLGDAARACRLALEAEWKGHEVFFITADDTSQEVPSEELARTYYPDVEIRKPLEGYASLFDNSKAKRLLGWEPSFSWRER